MKYTEAEELLETARSKPAGKPIDNNTRIFRRGPETLAVQLHSTDIVTLELDENGDTVYTLKTGGWLTPTTKDRINKYAPGTVYSVRGVWHYDWQHHDGGYNSMPFVDGMKVTEAGPVREPKTSENSVVDLTTKKVERAIKQYIDGYVEHVKENGLEQPGPGDCFGCQFETVSEDKTTPLTALAGPLGIDHIVTHLEEGYFVPSLLWRAIKTRGYRRPEFVWHWIANDRDGLERLEGELRSYFTKLKPYLVQAMSHEARVAAAVRETKELNASLEVN